MNRPLFQERKNKKKIKHEIIFIKQENQVNKTGKAMEKKIKRKTKNIPSKDRHKNKKKHRKRREKEKKTGNQPADETEALTS